jgi:hypothetical protein
MICPGTRSARGAQGGNLWKGIGGCIVSAVQADYKSAAAVLISSRQGPGRRDSVQHIFLPSHHWTAFETLLDCAALL